MVSTEEKKKNNPLGFMTKPLLHTASQTTSVLSNTAQGGAKMIKDTTKSATEAITNTTKQGAKVLTDTTTSSAKAISTGSNQVFETVVVKPARATQDMLSLKNKAQTTTASSSAASPKQGDKNKEKDNEEDDETNQSTSILSNPIQGGAKMVKDTTKKATDAITNTTKQGAKILTDTTMSGAKAISTGSNQVFETVVAKPARATQEMLSLKNKAQTTTASPSAASPKQGDKNKEKDNEDDDEANQSTSILSNPIQGGAKMVKDVTKKTTDAITNTTKQGAKVLTDTTKSGAKAISTGSNQVFETVVVKPARATHDMLNLKNKTIRNQNDKDKINTDDDGYDTKEMPALPPDETLHNDMEVVLTKKLKGVTINDFFEVCWDESKQAFYQSWLEETGNLNVKVGDWQEQGQGDENAEPWTGTWDKQPYERKRTITFQMEQSNPMFSGLVDVTQTHFCRVEANDRCVVSIMNSLLGIPFSDAFNVQIRWVVTRMGSSNLQAEVGVFVVFVKSCFVAGKIRSATVTETTKLHANLYQTMKKVFGQEEGEEEEEMAPVEIGKRPPAKSLIDLLSMCFPMLKPEPEDENDLKARLYEIENKLRTVKTLPQLNTTPQAQEEQNQVVLHEMTDMKEALDAILIRKMDLSASYTFSKKTKGVVGEEAKTDNPYEKPIRSGFLKPVKQLFSKLQEVDSKMTKATQSLLSSSLPGGKASEREGLLDNIDEVEPDHVLPGMNVIISKVVPGVLLRDFYNTFIDDDSKEGERPLLLTWLQEEGHSDIEVGKWETATADEPFVDDWSGESFEQRRTVSYRFPKSTFLPKSSLTAMASQTSQQYVRLEGSQRLVMASTIVVAGLPFSDCFEVHTRWVVSQTADGNLTLKVGLFVLITKWTVFESRIRAGAIREVTKRQLRFYKKIRAALDVEAENSTNLRLAVEEVVKEEAPAPKMLSFESCIPRMRKFAMPESTLEEDSRLKEEFKAVDRKLRAARVFLQDDKTSKPEDLNFFVEQLGVFVNGLDQIVSWHDGKEGDAELV